MDAAIALDALKSGDITAFVAAVEWDEGEWINVPADLRHADENPFIGRLGAVTVGVVKTDTSGKYELRFHTHPEGTERATECYRAQLVDIHEAVDMATAMMAGSLPAVGVVSMSDIPYTGQYI